MERNYPGPCSACCTCPMPQFAYVSRAASKSKSACAYLNTSNGNYYFQQTVTQTWNVSFSDGASGSGSMSTTQIDTNTYSISGRTCSGPVCSGSGSGVQSSSYGVGAEPQSVSFSCTYAGCGNWTGTETIGYSGGSETNAWNAAPPGFVGGGDTYTTSTTYADEYTDAQLQTYVAATLPGWGPLSTFGDSYPSELASAELSSGAGTYSILESKYAFAWQVPPSQFYELTWVERFTPDGGGSPTDTAKSFTWDGTIPNGYNPSDSSTWPRSTVFEVDYPSSNGSISLHNLAVNCGAGPTTLFS